MRTREHTGERVKQTRRKIRKEDRRRNVMTLKRERDKMTVSPNVKRETRETQMGHRGAGAVIFLNTHTLNTAAAISNLLDSAASEPIIPPRFVEMFGLCCG